MWWETIAFLIAYFVGNTCAKYYENPAMLSRVKAENVGDVFEIQCKCMG